MQADSPREAQADSPSRCFPALLPPSRPRRSVTIRVDGFLGYLVCCRKLTRKVIAMKGISRRESFRLFGAAAAPAAANGPATNCRRFVVIASIFSASLGPCPRRGQLNLRVSRYTGVTTNASRFSHARLDFPSRPAYAKKRRSRSGIEPAGSAPPFQRSPCISNRLK